MTGNLVPSLSLKDRAITPHLALLAVQIMFGTWPILGKVVLRSVSSTSLITLRVTGAAIAFLIMQGKLAQLRRMPRKHLAQLLLCTLLGIVGNQFLYVSGLSLTTVINVAVLGTAIPVFTLMISIALGYDRPSFRRIFGIVLAASGVLYLVNPVRADFSSQNTLGNLLVVGSSVSYGAYLAGSKGLVKRYGALNVITWLFLLGAIITLPIGAHSLRTEHLSTFSSTLWLAVAYIIIVPTVGAYYLNAWALTRVTPSTVATYIYLQPLIAFGLAPILLGETWNTRTLVASLLIFGGVGIVTKRSRSQASKEVAERPEALSH